MKAIRFLIVLALSLAALAGVGLALAWQGTVTAEANSTAAPAAPSGLPLPYLSDANVADAPYSSPNIWPPPAVDGRIAPGEYAHAGKVTFPGYGGDVEVFIRQNAGVLYIAFDSPDMTPYPYPSGGGPGPAFQVFLDTLHNDGPSPQPDDYRLTVQKDGVTWENVGTGTGWGVIQPAANWVGAVYTGTWGWQAELAINFVKLGIVSPSQVLGLGLAEVWTPSWPTDWYWPRGGFYANPSTWGDLVSSSGWGTFYWKPGPWQDYAPSGMPDFDQRQPGWMSGTVWTHCGPAAAANSLWWFDSKFETPGHPPPVISDTYRLVRSYGQWDDHDVANPVPLVNDLAGYFGTNQGITGTSIISMFFGMHRYLRDRGLWDDYIVTLVEQPDFRWVADEVMRSEDVILLLGFWQEVEDPPGSGVYRWVRVGGHYVSVAGVDPTPGPNQAIAFSDPFLDARENGLSPSGRVLSGTLLTHYPPHPGPDPTIHNDAGNVSHDIYGVRPTSSPGGTWGPRDYPSWFFVESGFGANPNPHLPTEPFTPAGSEVQVEVEFALTVSPYTWKASGEWVGGEGLIQGFWRPWEDYAPNGVPDFDQKQDAWQPMMSPKWTFCGPVAAANSLWWFDSKFEPAPLGPPHPPPPWGPMPVNNNYPLVTSYFSMLPIWDDHDPLNVEDQTLNRQFVDDLAWYMDTDGRRTGSLHAGTVVTDMYQGLVSYILDHNLRQGYVITQVRSPDFWWVAEEVEISEDVILLMGYWQDKGTPGYPQWVRVGGHYVTLPGVDKQGGLLAFSDPWLDRIEKTWPYAGMGSVPGWPSYMGRVANGWLIDHIPIPGHPVTYHNDAGNVSHDVYRVVGTDSPGGVWGPEEYATSVMDIENFVGQNQPPGPGTIPDPTLPVQAEVEWAVAVSPVADVWISKTVTPTVVGYGDWITFTITFGNDGSLAAQDVVITDILPPQLGNASYKCWVSNGLTITARPGPAYTWDVPDLAWREWGVITATAQVNAANLRLDVTNDVSIKTTSVEQYQVPPLANAASATFTIQNPDIAVAPAKLEAALNPGGTVTRTLAISNGGAASLTWTLAEAPAVGWLAETPSSGALPPAGYNHVIVTFTAPSTPTVYVTTLRISSDDPDENPFDVPVTLTVMAAAQPDITVSPLLLAVTLNPGGAATRTLTLGNVGTANLNWTLAESPTRTWLSESPASGGIAPSGSTDVSVVFNATGLSAGTYTTTLQITSDDPDESLVSVPVTLTVTATPLPDIEVSPLALAATLNPGDTAARTLTISNTGAANLTWALTEAPARAWLNESPTGGALAPSGRTGVTVGFDATGLGAGTYTTTLQITSDDPDEPQVDVAATLVVTTACIPVSGAGLSYTPADPRPGQVVTFTGSVLAGSKPITYTWDWGDGSAGGVGQVLTHAFPSTPTLQPYTVTLTVDNACTAPPIVVQESIQLQLSYLYLPIVVRVYP